MAAAAKGTQSKTAEQHNQERRAAKARQMAVRKARAEAERKKAENYKAGFKFVRNDGYERIEQERLEKELQKRLAVIRVRAEELFRFWLDRLRSGVQLIVETECDKEEFELVALDRVREMLQSPSTAVLFNHTEHNGRLIVQRIQKAWLRSLVDRSTVV